MTLDLEVVRDKPQGSWMLDTVSPFPDESGYNRTATLTGTQVKHTPLVNGALYSTQTYKNATIAFDTPIFQQGNEKQDFTIQTAVRPNQITSGAKAQTYYENILINPSFEGAVTTGWYTNWFGGSGSTGTTSMGNTGGAVGTYFYRKTWTAIGGTSQATGAGFSVPVTPGKTYSLGMFVRGSKPQPWTREVTWYAADNTTVISSAPVSFDSATNPANTWSFQKYENVTAPTGAAFVHYTVGPYNGPVTAWAVGDTYDVDGGIAVEGPICPSYFDGSMPGYEWTGPANASISRTRKDVSLVNYFADGKATTVNTSGSPFNLGVWRNSRWFGNGGAAGNYTAEVGTGPLPGINTFVRKTWTTAATANGDSGFDHFFNQVRVNPGETWTFTSYLRPSSAGKNAQYNVYRSDGAKVALTRAYGAIVPLTANVWNKVSFTYTIPAGCYWINPVSDVQSGPAWAVGDTLDGSGASFTMTPAEVPFFTGDSVGAEWWSTPNNTNPILLASVAEQQILGNLNQMDGLTINDTVVSFVTKYLTSGECRASYDLQQLRNVLVRGVHTATKNQLFVDGVLVSEVPITQAQQADSFVVTDTKLYSGATNSSARLALNAVSTFTSALSSATAERHAAVAKNTMTGEDVARAFIGFRIPLGYNGNDIFLEQTWESDADWNRGVRLGTVAQGGQLVPHILNGVSVPSSWTAMFPISAGGTSIYSVSATWRGEGVTVDASLDGNTWVSVSRDANISLIPQGFNPTDKVLLIRVRFAGNKTNDTSYLDSLVVTGLQTGVLPKLYGRTVTMSNTASVEQPGRAIDLPQNWGTEITGGGRITVSASDESEPMDINTVMFWARKTGLSNWGTSLAGTNYVNGALQGWASIPFGEWALVTLVLSTPVTGSFYISGDGQFGEFILFERQLTAQEMLSILASYMGRPATRQNDNSIISIAESPTAVSIYAHDWSISSAG